MPERFPTKNPTVLIGSTVESGVPNTGQSLWTPGGTKTATVFSGTAGGDALIQAGGGRLDAAFWHTNGGNLLALSGQSVTFYDSALAVSGGPLPGSGHKVIAVLGFGTYRNASGDAFQGGTVQQFGFVYTSGLCFASRSGQAGFSVSYTPVTSN